MPLAWIGTLAVPVYQSYVRGEMGREARVGGLGFCGVPRWRGRERRPDAR
jgi:hypothetical protein